MTAWFTLAVTSVVALAFLLPLGLLIQHSVRQRAVDDARDQATMMVAVLAVTTDRGAVQRAIAIGGETAADRVAVRGLAGADVGTVHAERSEVGLASRLREARTSRVPGGLSYLKPVDVGGATVVVEVFVPDAELSRGVQRAWYTLGGVAAALVLASLIFGDRLATKVVRSMRALARAATGVGDGRLEVRVRLGGPREVAEAGKAFNRMADKLVADRIAERELVADLSHRLRTPLTVLRLDAETLDTAVADIEAAARLKAGSPLSTGEQDKIRTTMRIRHAITTLEREIDELIRTTREAARSATATGSAAAAASVAATGSPTPPTSSSEGSAGQETAGRCDVSEVVRERMVFWSAVAGDQDRPCTVLGVDSPAPVPLPRADLAAALDAVVGNVLRYTPQGTALEVAVTRRDGWVALRVDDAGQGIPDPERAMRRGVSDHGSTGLGLDIARRVTQAAHGSVNIGKARLGGASVIMLFEDADEPPKQASRFGLIGRLTREPRKTLERRKG